MKITEALIAEHTIFLTVFDQIEKALPSLSTPMEIRTMAQVVEGMLKDHARAETDLAYLALDHALAHKGRLDHMHQEHHEIDDRLNRVHEARTCSEGRRLLQSALSAARDHFRAEEKGVFPLIERTLESTTLVSLGTAWLKRKAEPSNRK
jgi:hemerythrin-like domain-containing protein